MLNRSDLRCTVNSAIKNSVSAKQVMLNYAQETSTVYITALLPYSTMSDFMTLNFTFDLFRTRY